MAMDLFPRCARIRDIAHGMITKGEVQQITLACDSGRTMGSGITTQSKWTFKFLWISCLNISAPSFILYIHHPFHNSYKILFFFYKIHD